MKPRLLDLFCGAGGAAMGYHEAGFEVVGVDIVRQENYPFEFWHWDALAPALHYALSRKGLRFDAIHASPPCQFATAYKRRPGVAEQAVNLIPQTRELLEPYGVPYVIENVPTAREHLRNPIQLCGSSFGLDVQRHRLFETSFPCMSVPCDHSWQTPRFPQATNRKNLRSTVEVGAWRCAHLSPAAMGIDWMTNAEISQAIPPAFTRHIGAQLLDQFVAAGFSTGDNQK